MIQTQHHQLTGELQQCITNCLDCHKICEQVAHHCLRQSGRQADSAHIRRLLDCAQICQTSAGFLLRDSEFRQRTCAICAEVCERCAQDCERLADGDQQMLACARACRRCVETCRRVLATAA